MAAKHSLRWLAGIVYLWAFLGSAAVCAEGETRLYANVTPPQATETGDKIEIREVFWYTCPHCYGFKLYLDKWLENKPDDVEVVYMPAVYSNGRYLEYARAFYSAQLLNVMDKIHGPLFEAVHVKKRQLTTEKDFMDFFAEQGISNEDFKKTYHSFAVDMLVRKAETLTQKYAVEAVPSMIINGKYRILGAKINGHANFLKVMDELIERERSAKTGLAQTVPTSPSP